MIIKIEVLQEDIDNGVRYMSTNCAIALAIKRQFPEFTVSVGSYDCTLWGKSSDNKFVSVPHAQFHKIHKFDTGKTITPFSFELEIDEDKLAEIINIDDLLKTPYVRKQALVCIEG